jgi:ABC-2 type transport system ATP-binding protein
MNIVETENLVKIYEHGLFKKKRTTAVNKINLKIEQGNLFGLIGPNGSGKTTFINLITGFLSATSGTIKIFGYEPSSIEIKKNIGYLPEKFEFEPHMTGRELLDFYGSFYDISNSDLKKRIDYLIDITSLIEFADMQTKTYSKGTIQKLGVAQALLNKPKLLILDEPYNGLDPETNRNLKRLLKKLAKEGTTIIISSHLLSNIENACSHIGIISRGKIIYNGSPEELTSDENETVVSFKNLTQDDKVLLTSMCEQKFNKYEVSISSSKKSLEEKFLELVGAK